MSVSVVSPAHERLVWPPPSDSGVPSAVPSATEAGLSRERRSWAMTVEGGRKSRASLSCNNNASPLLVHGGPDRVPHIICGHFTGETVSIALHEEEINFNHMILEKIFRHTHTNAVSKNQNTH